MYCMHACKHVLDIRYVVYTLVAIRDAGADATAL
jgi:hypothetical protein